MFSCHIGGVKTQQLTISLGARMPIHLTLHWKP